MVNYAEVPAFWRAMYVIYPHLGVALFHSVIPTKSLEKFLKRRHNK